MEPGQSPAHQNEGAPMSATKVLITQFQGSGKVFSREATGLASILRGMLIDNARLRVEVSGVHDFTDNSTGVVGAGVVALPLPFTPIDATLAGGATVVALNASLAKIQNAGLVIRNTINEGSALLGLPANIPGPGVQVTADTIPVLDQAGAAGNGVAAAEFNSTVAAFRVAGANLARVLNGANAMFVALGLAPLSEKGLGNHALNFSLAAIPPAVAVAAGPGAVAIADVNVFLTAYANDVATLAAAWNAAMNQGAPGAGALHVIAG